MVHGPVDVQSKKERSVNRVAAMKQRPPPPALSSEERGKLLSPDESLQCLKQCRFVLQMFGFTQAFDETKAIAISGPVGDTRIRQAGGYLFLGFTNYVFTRSVDFVFPSD
jgi:hypothetical protein